MAELSNAEYLYRWGQQFSGAILFGRAVRKAKQEVMAEKDLTLNDLIDAFVVLEANGLVEFSQTIEEGSLADYLYRAEFYVEFKHVADWEERLAKLRASD